MAIAPAKPSKGSNSLNVFSKAFSNANPSVTRVTILAATDTLTISSPTPVKLTPQN